jgi:hypothetical protein
MFDDVVITEELDKYNSNINRIHLFNLNGVFIPLSVFLNAAYEAFESTNKEDLKKYIKIKATLPSVTYKSDGELKIDDWYKYIDEKKNNFKMEIHFFKNFVDFIKENI